ncbi:lipopolysaccharide assembly protein LapA domain-containing protein [Caldovatus aquaticus]|uniref:Lipopolysaccharide assembly protein LapA domain-containing protein n=1 Tax=Caldovatus aquaticus TaxID=2865671 RepID=A0ABS7F4R0_9PROT|nr:lipopolysaccharide assembly protein LapA domain-containing protein [Caldovatus aquaticus]MBW8270612.1 lipopolysaccharide assembly protein LapA domain-containing protein [Caldovatus aquaticus]
MRWVLILPLLVLLVLFALSNREAVALRLWPFDLALVAPVGVAMLVLAAVGFLAGALVAWAASLGARRRARRLERAAKALEAELAALRAREAAAAAAERRGEAPSRAAMPALAGPAEAARR